MPSLPSTLFPPTIPTGWERGRRTLLLGEEHQRTPLCQPHPQASGGDVMCGDQSEGDKLMLTPHLSYNRVSGTLHSGNILWEEKAWCSVEESLRWEMSRGRGDQGEPITTYRLSCLLFLLVGSAETTILPSLLSLFLFLWLLSPFLLLFILSCNKDLCVTLGCDIRPQWDPRQMIILASSHWRCDAAEGPRRCRFCLGGEGTGEGSIFSTSLSVLGKVPGPKSP